jgi:hypothetical protein
MGSLFQSFRNSMPILLFLFHKVWLPVAPSGLVMTIQSYDVAGFCYVHSDFVA